MIVIIGKIKSAHRNFGGLEKKVWLDSIGAFMHQDK